VNAEPSVLIRRFLSRREDFKSCHSACIATQRRICFLSRTWDTSLSLHKYAIGQVECARPAPHHSCCLYASVWQGQGKSQRTSLPQSESSPERNDCDWDPLSLANLSFGYRRSLAASICQGQTSPKTNPTERAAASAVGLNLRGHPFLLGGAPRTATHPCPGVRGVSANP